MSKSKHLIVPGMAKSGTTFLWDQFVNRTDRVNYYKGKELGYLSVGSDLQKYKSFFENQNDEKVYLDVTPQYSDTYKAFCGNTKEALAEQVLQIIFCLRDPVARAFSHYRHDLSTHFWMCAMGDYSFYSEGALRLYLRPYFDIVSELQKSFGAERVHGYSFRQTAEKLPIEILSFLGLPDDWSLDLSINPAAGGGLPYVLYDAKRVIIVEQDGVTYKLPPKTLLLCTNFWSQMLPNYPEDIAHLILKHAANWTNEFERHRLGDSWKMIEEDYNQTLHALGMKSETLEKKKKIPYKGRMPIGQNVLDQLERVDNLEDIAARIYQSEEEPLAVVGNEGLPENEISLAGQILKINALFKGKSTLPERVSELKKTILQFGPVKHYVNSFVLISLELGEIDEIIDVLNSIPGIGRFLDRAVISAKLELKRPQLEELYVQKLIDYLKL